MIMMKDRVRNTLSEITADLVEFEENEPFLARLFQLEPGIWAKLDCLCDNLADYKERLTMLQKTFQEKVRVTWLNYPDSRYGDGYCLILFFADEHQWHNVALYNKRRLQHVMEWTDHALIVSSIA
jgi:hypothetical protein